jgi:hypothetical protein
MLLTSILIRVKIKLIPRRLHMSDSPVDVFTAFSGTRFVARAALLDVALQVKALLQAGESAPISVFNDLDGSPVDLNLSGDARALHRRYAQKATQALHDEPTHQLPVEAIKRQRGRPKLGVVAREVTLLPRHWDWLAGQPGGASVALRKLIETARRASAETDQRRLAQERTYRVMAAMAGDASGFEEASRALFAADAAAFARYTATWPADVRDYLHRLADGAFAT